MSNVIANGGGGCSSSRAQDGFIQAGLPFDVAVVMITFNEGHNLCAVFENLRGWANEVFVVDSYSSDRTVEIALSYGATVVQRRFRGFGDQWNFAVSQLPIRSPWTMKLDPDERLTPELKQSILDLTRAGTCAGITIERHLWFMGKILPVTQNILRVWRTGTCRFSDVLVNEYPHVEGPIAFAKGTLEHHDSPSLDHWTIKQNRYTTLEATNQFKQGQLAAQPRLFGNSLQRRIWLKKHFWRFPGRYTLLFWYHLLWLGAWRAGRVGFIWAHLRTEVYRQWEFKYQEMTILGRVPVTVPVERGLPDPRVPQYD